MTRIQQNAIYKILGITIAVGALFGVLFLRSVRPVSVDRSESDQVVVAGKRIPVTVANTDALRAKGLSGTKSLASGTGKLFVFDTPGTYGFWMKDMHYPIDIVWIDAEKRVVAIEANVQPESYPKVFYPPVDVLYVLEINAGQAQVLGISAQSEINFSVNY